MFDDVFVSNTHSPFLLTIEPKMEIPPEDIDRRQSSRKSDISLVLEVRKTKITRYYFI